MVTQKAVTERFVTAYYELYRLRVVKSKTEFCAPLNLPVSNFVIMERGDRSCTLRQLCALVNAWNVSPTWLMSGEGDMFTKQI